MRRSICVIAQACLVCSYGCSPEPGSGATPDPLAGCGWGADETGGVEEFNESQDFQEFVSNYVIEPRDGEWIIEGDIITHDYKEVIAAYLRSAKTEPQDNEPFRSTVMCDTVLDIDRIWDPAAKLAITYCLDSSWDEAPQLRDAVTEALAKATLDWETAADINFIALDSGSSCSYDNGARYIISYNACELPCDGEYLGLASFPWDPMPTVEFGTHTFQDSEKLAWVVSHELGHTLGLYHEHTRYTQTNFVCAWSAGPDGFWRGVTEADSISVMGYPQCEGTSPLPHPSALDRAGLAYLYNLPRPLANAEDRTPLVWHRPLDGDYVVWEPIVGPGQTIAFTETIACYDPENCEAGASRYWKPILYRNDNAVDVLMYGPGEIQEQRFRNLAGSATSDLPLQIDSRSDVPILLDCFFDDDDRSIWWIRPGEVEDSLWQNLDGTVAMTNDYDSLELTDEHHSPTTGLTLNSHRAIFWLSPTDDTGHLTIFAGNSFGSLAIDKTSCGLSDGVTYNSIPGDYDGDGEREIIWHDPNTGVAIYWSQLPGCTAYSTFPIGAAKLSAFRLHGNRDSLFIYRPQDGTMGVFDVLNEESQASLSIDVDASPILRDFDNNGCTDILWYAPHLQESELWQSNCDATFVKTLVQPPQDAYPLGFGLGHGRG